MHGTPDERGADRSFSEVTVWDLPHLPDAGKYRVSTGRWVGTEHLTFDVEVTVGPADSRLVAYKAVQSFLFANPGCDSARLDPAQQEAVRTYTQSQGLWNVPVTNWLMRTARGERVRAPIGVDAEKYVRLIDSGLEPLTEESHLIRIVPLGAFETDGLHVGSRIRESAWTSTSLGPERHFAGDVRLELTVPAGVKAMYIWPTHAGTADDREVLLERGLTIEIDSVGLAPGRDMRTASLIAHARVLPPARDAFAQRRSNSHMVQVVVDHVPGANGTAGPAAGSRPTFSTPVAPRPSQFMQRRSR